MKNKALVNGVKKLEKLSMIAFEAREAMSNEFEFCSEFISARKHEEKSQLSFEKFAKKLAQDFAKAGENANDYALVFETIDAREFQEEVECY